MIKQVIVVRKDLNMRKGKMCAQVAHAAMKVFLDRISCQLEDSITINLTDEMSEWIIGAFTKIVVGCDSLDDILWIKAKCDIDNVPYAVIEDNGTTEFKGVKTITCISVGPDKAEVIDEITGKFKLL